MVGFSVFLAVVEVSLRPGIAMMRQRGWDSWGAHSVSPGGQCVLRCWSSRVFVLSSFTGRTCRTRVLRYLASWFKAVRTKRVSSHHGYTMSTHLPVK